MTGPLKRSREESSEEAEGPCRKQQICYLINTDETEEMDWSPSPGQLSIGTETTYSNDTPQERSTTIICYGSLTDSKAEVTYLKSKDTWINPWTSFHVFNLEYKDYAYRLAEDDGSTFGVLDNNTTLQLKSIQGLGEISFRVVISSSNFSRIPKNACSKKTRINVTINILGPENIAEKVGEKLEDEQTYLQHPVFLEQGIKYANPHYFYDDEALADLRHLIGPMPTDNKSQQISRDIQSILESLDHVQIPLTHGFGIERIESLRLVETKLRPHQVEGVCFILSREDAFISEKVDREFRQLLNPRGFFSQHAGPSRGGVIADSMGLGKTLTMLTAIACSKEAAGEHLGPTLIVLPSRQVLDVWDSEIARRFHPGTFEVHHFHGCNRAKEDTALKNGDIVLTTYQTLAADFKRGQILAKVGWLRVVLDEG
ncbi:hypothetical protein TWF730_011191 [Orbilia blumenaviensis]|uniref:Helicase ATP-binding domain-containing protein n=1 Tax=Orbilia blumenaviensis TaxID=1796055 RepID=A0AAV9UN43_9PEZI